MLSRFAEADVTDPDGMEPGAAGRAGADEQADGSPARPLVSRDPDRVICDSAEDLEFMQLSRHEAASSDRAERLRRQNHATLADGRIVEVPDELLVDDRAAAFAHRGVLLIQQGKSSGHSSRWGEALAATLEAAEIFTKLSDKFGNVGDRRNLAIAFSHACKFLRNLQLHDEAIRCGSESVMLWRSLAQESPAEREDLAIGLTNLADVLCSAGRPAEAIVHCAEAIEILHAGGEEERKTVSPHLYEALSDLAHHQMEAGDFGAAWSALSEAASLKGVELGETAEAEDADLLATYGYLNGLAAELFLRTGDLDEARDCAVLSMSAYGQYVSENQSGFFHLRGALERLLRVLDAAGDEGEAAALRSDLAHVLVEPDPPDYDSHIKKFKDFRRVIEER
jgi:tetratricopeptide (TPR) repeat protein